MIRLPVMNISVRCSTFYFKRIVSQLVPRCSATSGNSHVVVTKMCLVQLGTKQRWYCNPVWTWGFFNSAVAKLRQKSLANTSLSYVELHYHCSRATITFPLQTTGSFTTIVLFSIPNCCCLHDPWRKGVVKGFRPKLQRHAQRLPVLLPGLHDKLSNDRRLLLKCQPECLRCSSLK